MKKEEFVSMALSFLGFAEINFGGQSVKDGFDCSWFVRFLLGKAGYSNPIPRYANEIFDSFGVLVHEQLRDAGDLIFFSYKKGFPNHVGVLVSKDEYIHLPSRHGVREVSVNKINWKIIQPQVGVQQIYSSNPIGFKRITVKNGRYQQIFLK